MADEKNIDNVLYICVEDPDIKSMVDQLADIMSWDEFQQIETLALEKGLDYRPVLIYQKYEDPKKRINGHKYDVIKKIDVFKD